MALSTFETITYITTVFYNLQTEIAIFFVAFFAHAMFFGRYGIRSSKSASSRQQTSNPAGRAESESTGPQAPPVANSPRGPHARVMAEAAEAICKSGSSTDSVADKIRSELKDVPKQDIVQALMGLLQGASRTKATTPALLLAVRLVLQESGLKPSPAFSELLLRGFFSLRMSDDFETTLKQARATHGSVAGINILALRAALRDGNLELVLERLEGTKALWHQPGPTASNAPQALLQQIARLAAERGASEKLWEKLREFQLFEESLSFLLAECMQREDMASFRKVESMGRAMGSKLTAWSYKLMMKGAKTSAEALRIFMEASAQGAVNKDLAVTAIERASADHNSELADAVMKQLPAKAPVETAGRLLSFYAGVHDSRGASNLPHADEHPAAQQGAAENCRERDSIVLKLYVQHFSDVDFSGDAAAQRLVADAALRCGKTDVLAQLLAGTTETSKLVPLLKSFVVDGELSDALAIFAACPGKSPCLYNAMIDVCIDCKSMANAQRLMLAATQSGVADVVTYNTILKAHLAQGNVPEAHKTIEAMRANNLQPNCVTFNELLDAKIKTSVKDAWNLVDEMQACGVKPNHITCSILLKTIQTHSTATTVERILTVLEDMEGEMDEVLLSSVVEACIRIGRPDLLVPHLEKQRTSKRIQVKGPHTYGSIIRAYGFVQDVRAVWDTWKEMRTRRIVPTSVTLGCMVEALVTNGETEAGYELIKEMLEDEECKPHVNAIIYCSVLKGFSHKKQFDRVWSVYQEMLEHELQFSIVTFNTLVDACARSGEMGRISALLESMDAQGIAPNIITYSAILKGYCQENRLEEAFALLDGMVQTTKFRPDEIMYNTLLDGCARQGLFDRGMRLLEEMQKNGVHPTNFTLSVLVKLATRSKRTEKAFELADELSSKYNFRLNVHVYSNLVQCCTVNRDLPRAMEVLERMLRERVRPDTRTYQLLLRGCIQAGKGDDAAGLLRAAAGLRGVHPRLAAASPNSLQPKGSLPSALIEETLEGIAGLCRDQRTAVALLQDLRRLPGLKLDPKLQLRLTAKAVQK
mmetsp:Transcript_31065/g.56495  ORF Transcript_31065/g.56495 Transcript_31065/m.56495 type:complete len:1046 (+) Transcript_31065:176-3313(+)